MNVDFTIRHEQNSDPKAAREVIIAAFNRQYEANLVDDLRIRKECRISLVALNKENEIVGHIMFSEMVFPARSLALAPVSVLPSYQNNGIGGRLIERGIQLAKAENWKAVIVLGDPGFYGRRGFDVSLMEGFSSPYAGPYLMALELEENALSERKGEILYPSAFNSIED